MDNEIKKYDEFTIRVDFAVRHPASEKFVTFGADVTIDMIADFFERAGLSVKSLFEPEDILRGVYVDKHDIRQNFIIMLKHVRRISHCGLKEAKDSVEFAADYGAPIVVMSATVAAKFADELNKDGFRAHVGDAKNSKLTVRVEK